MVRRERLVKPPETSSPALMALAGMAWGVYTIRGRGHAQRRARRAGDAVVARVVVAGPDALARLLWPLSADALAEAYLRGDIDIEGDITAAIVAGPAARSIAPRVLSDYHEAS